MLGSLISFTRPTGVISSRMPTLLARGTILPYQSEKPIFRFSRLKSMHKIFSEEKLALESTRLVRS